MPLLRSLSDDATLADLRALYGDVLDPLGPYVHRLMRGPSPLTPAERELIAAYVSGINGCRYCYGRHSLAARGFGVDKSVFEILLADIDLAPVEPRLKPLLHYVRRLTEAPSRLTKADADAVYEAGWSDEALFHAIAICSLQNNVVRLVEGSGIVDTPAGSALGADALLRYGY